MYPLDCGIMRRSHEHVQAKLSQLSKSDAHMDISTRLRAAIEDRYKSIQAFSRAADVPYRTIYQYLSGTRLPGAEVLVKLCAQLGLNIHWLLTGEGDKYVSTAVLLGSEASLEHDASTQDPGGDDVIDDVVDWRLRAEAAEQKARELEADLRRFQATVDTYRRHEVTQLLSDLGLTDMALLARRGTQEGIWMILSVLEQQPAHSMELEKLAEALQAQGTPLRLQDLVADLAILGHKGLIRETLEGGSTLVQLVSSVSRVAGREVGDVSQVAKDCVRELVRKIVPLAEERKGRGYFARISCRVPAGGGRVLVEQLPRLLIEHCEAMEVEGQIEETVDVVFGVAHNGT